MGACCPSGLDERRETETTVLTRTRTTAKSQEQVRRPLLPTLDLRANLVGLYDNRSLAHGVGLDWEILRFDKPTTWSHTQYTSNLKPGVEVSAQEAPLRICASASIAVVDAHGVESLSTSSACRPARMYTWNEPVTASRRGMCVELDLSDAPLVLAVGGTTAASAKDGEDKDPDASAKSVRLSLHLSPCPQTKATTMDELVDPLGNSGRGLRAEYTIDAEALLVLRPPSSLLRFFRGNDCHLLLQCSGAAPPVAAEDAAFDEEGGASTPPGTNHRRWLTVVLSEAPSNGVVKVALLRFFSDVRAAPAPSAAAMSPMRSIPATKRELADALAGGPVTKDKVASLLSEGGAAWQLNHIWREARRAGVPVDAGTFDCFADDSRTPFVDADISDRLVALVKRSDGAAGGRGSPGRMSKSEREALDALLQLATRCPWLLTPAAKGALVRGDADNFLSQLPVLHSEATRVRVETTNLVPSVAAAMADVFPRVSPEGALGPKDLTRRFAFELTYEGRLTQADDQTGITKAVFAEFVLRTLGRRRGGTDETTSKAPGLAGPTAKGEALFAPCARKPYVYWVRDVRYIDDRGKVAQALGQFMALALLHSFPVDARYLHPYIWRKLHDPVNAVPHLEDLAILRGEQLVDGVLDSVNALRRLATKRAAKLVRPADAEDQDHEAAPQKGAVLKQKSTAEEEELTKRSLLFDLLHPDSLVDYDLISEGHASELRKALASGISAMDYAELLLPTGAVVPVDGASAADTCCEELPKTRARGVGLILEHAFENEASRHGFDHLIGHWASAPARAAGRDDSDGGFYRAVGGEWILRCTAADLRELVCGPATLDVAAMREAVTYGPDNSGGQPYDDWRAAPGEREAVDLFWKAVDLLEPAEVRRLLWWWTGSEAPPPAGFGAMEHHWSDFWGITGIQISVKGRGHPVPDQLQAHTCFNQLELPLFGRIGRAKELNTPEAVAEYIRGVILAAERAPLDFRDG